MPSATSRDYKALLNQGRAFFRDAGGSWARLERDLRATIASLEREENEPHLFTSDGDGGWLLGPLSVPVHVVPVRPRSDATYFWLVIRHGRMPLSDYDDEASENAVRTAKGRLAAWLEGLGLRDLSEAIRGILVVNGNAFYSQADSPVRIQTDPRVCETCVEA